MLIFCALQGLWCITALDGGMLRLAVVITWGAQATVLVSFKGFRV